MIFLISLVFGISNSALSARAASDVSLPFRIESDAICFRNGDPDLAKTGIPFLGKLGVKKGVCQGIASISAAFRENSEFDPSAARQDTQGVRRLIAAVVRNHATRGTEKIIIPGFDSLGSFCRVHRMEFLRKAVWENTNVAISEILPHFLEFNRVKKQAIKLQRNPLRLRRELASALAEIHTELEAGLYPLLLYFSHVVMVSGYREVVGTDGVTRVTLEVYDSNHLETLRKITIGLDTDGLPSAENPMYWVVTPRLAN